MGGSTSDNIAIAQLGQSALKQFMQPQQQKSPQFPQQSQLRPTTQPMMPQTAAAPTSPPAPQVPMAGSMMAAPTDTTVPQAQMASLGGSKAPPPPSNAVPALTPQMWAQILSQFGGSSGGM